MSNGTGSGGGIGSGSGGGVGSGEGPGVGPGRGGGIGGGVFKVGGGVSAPRALSTPDPEYSEEARKAKYQGTVVLWLIVDQSGRPQQVRVARSLGMGLDQKAIEAVKQWKFEPAMKDGRPVAVQINVEVNFRLY
jgi:TonB family protein